MPKILSGSFQKFAQLLKTPEGLFLILGSITGLLFVFLTPPIQVYDERAHFIQSYAFSNADLLPEKQEYLGKYHYGPNLPSSVFVAGEVFIAHTAGVAETKFDTSLFHKYITQPLNPGTVEHRESGSGYSPVVYLPQVVGITIGKVFQTSPLIMIWLGRLANLAAWIAIVYLAIRIIPFGKWAVAVLALNPIVVFLSASLSADVMTIGLAFLFFSVIASTYVSATTISNRKLLCIAILLMLLVLTKPTNLLLGFLLFTIPWQRLESKKRYLLYSLGTIFIAAILVASWNHLVAPANQFNAQNMAAGRVIDPAQQLSGILHDPVRFIKILLLNFVILPDGHGYPGDLVLSSSVGSLGWGETKIPLWATLFYMLVAFLALLFTVGRSYVPTRNQKLIILSIFLIFCVANITAMYLYFTGVGQPLILGVQGRYFIPGAILLVALFTGHKKILTIDEKTLGRLLAYTMTIILCTSLLTVFVRYYGI